jgi:uncharacterized 2Fe-2S/4Fe-4S cluster protein (DUF4445 family)
MVKKTLGKDVKVHFDPDKIDIKVKQGTNLLQAALDAGVHINASCGGAGVCGTCRVSIEKGEVESERSDKLSEKDYENGIRLACRSRVITDVTVYIPVESRLEKAVVSREEKRAPEATASGWRYMPPLRKCYLELTPPTIGDNTSDLSRLLRHAKQQCDMSNMWVDFDVVKKLPRTLRSGKWRATVTTLVTATKPRAGDRRRPRIIDVEPGDTRSRYYSLAFDIGTTTVCGQLLDLNRGEIIAESIEYNKQVSYGEDIITRIAYSQKPGGLKRLQKAVVDNINSIIDELLKKTGIKVKDIGLIVVAGNTTMTQILLGLDPKWVRLAPYTPAANFIPPVEAKKLGIKVQSKVHLFSFPSIAS